MEYKFGLRNGFELFVKSYVSNASSNYTLLVVHGGPALCTHLELYPAFVPIINRIAKIKAVVFYDQLGCGNSDKPRDRTLYSIREFASHLMQLIDNLNANGHKQIVLFGHSFGGQIVLQCLVENELHEKVCGIIVSNSPLNEESYVRRQIFLRSQLEPCMQTFYEEEENATAENGSVESYVYNILIGVGETRITGSMLKWSVIDQILNQLHKVKALFITGTMDTIDYKDYHALMNHAQVEIFTGAGHAPFYEKEFVDRFWESIRTFIDSISYMDKF